MTPPRVLLCRGDLPTALLDEAHSSGKIELIRRHENDDGPTLRKWVMQRIGEVEAIVLTFAVKVDQELLNAAPHLRAVGTMSVGTDHIDMEACKDRNVQVFTTPDALDEAMAELTLMLILCTTRNVPLAARIVREGTWSEQPWTPLSFCGMSLRGKTIGFIGMGNIAQTAISYLVPFHPKKVLYIASKPKPFSSLGKLHQRGFKESDLQIENASNLQAIAQESDVVIVLTSLSSATRHLVDEKFFDRMKRTAYLVNVSRGPVVETQALVNALKHGRIAGAALDVVEDEPNVTSDHPLLQSECRDRVMILPHIGSATFETRRAMADVCAKQIIDYVADQRGRGDSS